jgi:hypothetical protein
VDAREERARGGGDEGDDFIDIPPQQCSNSVATV